MMRWENRGGGEHLVGVPGLAVSLVPTGLAWSVTVRPTVASGPAYTTTRQTREDARDVALMRALALYPAIVELMIRQDLESDPDDLADCRRRLLTFALTP